jgi:hypothetical protein
MADGMGARDWVMDGNPPRTPEEVEAQRRMNALRRKPVTARQMLVRWTFPLTDAALFVDVDFDEHNVPRINEVLDAARKTFPHDEVWFQGKPLEDVLIEWLCETPADEMERV